MKILKSIHPEAGTGQEQILPNPSERGKSTKAEYVVGDKKNLIII
ncbi:hypothetical protein CCAN11_2360015 [Capnocytophaga canimorsus]|uniref:Uncharacterized protein n=1 Tax=Capnocytophaga canimorsus TaxID=28188 RepID=A0A0B7IIV5_9FLAO|nr:hypothetical protein [Capnocytophaga canimorsus]CEN51820.1 hypothetical protein CCAN11_2360015 [Capnocytophaga canimorsus]